MILNKCGTHISHVQNILFISSDAHFILEGVVTTFQVYIIIVFLMTTMVNMLTQSENFKKSKNNKTFCNHMPSQLISFYLLISLEGCRPYIK